MAVPHYKSGGDGLPSNGRVSCLLTHKCVRKDHDFGELIRPVFYAHAVDILIDPFSPGEEVLAKIEALEWQALVFLFSRESWKSEYCQAELAAARRACVPVFTISRSRKPPRSLCSRVFLVCGAGENTKMLNELHDLAQAVHVRGSVRASLEQLRPPNMPETMRDAAKQLMDQRDRTALSEFLDCIEQIYTREIDCVARGSLALAVGRTGTQKAKQILLGWRSADDHPYPQDCISQAIELVNNKQTDNAGGNP